MNSLKLNESGFLGCGGGLDRVGNKHQAHGTQLSGTSHNISSIYGTITKTMKVNILCYRQLHVMFPVNTTVLYNDPVVMNNSLDKLSKTTNKFRNTYGIHSSTP